MPSATKALLAAGTLAMFAAPILAQQRSEAHLAPSCREEIMALCGADRSQIRACLASKISELSEPCTAQVRERMAMMGGQRGGNAGGFTSTPVTRTLSYGTHERQQIDLYAFSAPAAAGPAPLVVFVHGGGWSFGSHKAVQAKPAHFTAQGMAFASSGYRVLPDAPVEQQAADLGAALRLLRAEAAAGGYDPDRIVLMGHSAGAHLAALIATNPRYVGAEAFAAIRGVVLLDGAGYDVAAQMQRGDNQLTGLYGRVFGTNPAQHQALSPITHVGGPDAPHWLALYVAERPASKAQTEALVAALTRAGAEAQAIAITGTDHGRMNREIGTPQGADQTSAIDRFLKAALAL